MASEVLRALAETKIKWAFWLPGVSPPAKDLQEKLDTQLDDVEDEEDETVVLLSLLGGFSRGGRKK